MRRATPPAGQIVDEVANVALHDLTSLRAIRHLRQGGAGASHRLRLCRRLRRLSRRQPAFDPGRRAAHLRAAAIRSAGSASCRRRRPILTYATATTRAALHSPLCATRCSAATTSSAISTRGSRNGRTTASGRSSRRAARRTWRTRSSPALRSRNRSRRCAASSPSRCATAACSWPATPRTSYRRPAPRASISRCRTCSICRAR